MRNFVTINDLFKIISNKLKFNQEPKYFADRPNEVKHATCSSDKARKILNYKTTVSLDQSIDKVIKYIQTKGTKKFQYNYSLEIDNEKPQKHGKKSCFKFKIYFVISRRHESRKFFKIT